MIAVVLALSACGDDPEDTAQGTDVDLSRADAKLVGEAEGDHAGRSVATGDVDGDGSGDVLVGAGGDDEGGDGAGALYAVLGPVAGTVDLSEAGAKLVGEAEGDHAGWSATAADVDGDGVSDVLVGAPWEGMGGVGAGAAWLVLGPIGGRMDLGEADATFVGPDPAGAAGWSVAMGDLTGDRVEDVLVGAPGDGTGGEDAGAAFLVAGHASRPPDLSVVDATFVGEEPGDAAGWSLAVGDLDGDGVEDVLVGARQAARSGRSAGAAYVVLGPVSGTMDLSAADATFAGEGEDDQAGWSIAVGDVDGDGAEDILVGAPGEEEGGASAGAVYVVLGPARGDDHLSAADAKLAGEEPYAVAGTSLAVGDVDGDGVEDILVGAPGDEAGGAGAGTAYLVLGPVAGATSLPLAGTKAVGERAGDAAGASLGAGDVDGDHVTDVLVGAPDQVGGGVDAGAVYVLSGAGP